MICCTNEGRKKRSRVEKKTGGRRSRQYVFLNTLIRWGFQCCVTAVPLSIKTSRNIPNVFIFQREAFTFGFASKIIYFKFWFAFRTLNNRDSLLLADIKKTTATAY